MKNLARFLRDDLGVSAIEYALIAALIAVAIIIAVSFVGNEASSTYSNVASVLHSATGGS
jgi:pilus assembly protein Flp/PilA